MPAKKYVKKKKQTLEEIFEEINVAIADANLPLPIYVKRYTRSKYEPIVEIVKEYGKGEIDKEQLISRLKQLREELTMEIEEKLFKAFSKKHLYF